MQCMCTAHALHMHSAHVAPHRAGASQPAPAPASPCHAASISPHTPPRPNQADHEFERGAFELAALKYAKTRRSFEAVALRFLRAQQRVALRTFLLHKLDSIDERNTPQVC